MIKGFQPQELKVRLCPTRESFIFWPLGRKEKGKKNTRRMKKGPLEVIDSCLPPVSACHFLSIFLMTSSLLRTPRIHHCAEVQLITVANRTMPSHGCTGDHFNGAFLPIGLPLPPPGRGQGHKGERVKLQPAWVCFSLSRKMSR